MIDDKLEMADILFNDGFELEVSDIYKVVVEQDLCCIYDGEKLLGVTKEFQFSKDSPNMCRFTDMFTGNTIITPNPTIIIRDVVTLTTINGRGNRGGQPPLTEISVRVGFNDNINIRKLRFKSTTEHNSKLTDILPTLTYYHKTLYLGINEVEGEIKKRNINKLTDKL